MNIHKCEFFWALVGQSLWVRQKGNGSRLLKRVDTSSLRPPAFSGRLTSSEQSFALLLLNMISFLLFFVPLSSARLILLDENDQLKMPGVFDDEFPFLLDRKPAEGVLDVAKTKWTEDEMKMYQRGVEDNTTVVTFSIKVYYTIEVKISIKDR